MDASLKRPLIRKQNTNINLLKPGTYVRISFLRRAFFTEYRHKWSIELFQIYKQAMRDGIIVYFLCDLGGEKIEGSFYREELQKAHINDDTLYKVEKIPKTKKNKQGETIHLVKWLNWPDKFNSWEKDENIKNI